MMDDWFALLVLAAVFFGGAGLIYLVVRQLTLTDDERKPRH